ncbi:MAG TPA: glycosyltransferase [Candidatus Limnocylindrales bacterium]|nr:glycosyltransferase [Candidatus Limnocylindrales bacterium]
MSRPRIPEAVLSAAHDRSKARAERDWATADRLRAEIEAAGWTIVDRGTDFALSPSTPPDIDEGSRVRYGAPLNVPARFDEPAVGLASVVLVATDWPADVERALRALRATSPEGTRIVVVADAPSEEQEAALDEVSGDDVEIVWTSERLGYGAALNIGIRRAGAPIILLMDTSVEPTGDVITPLVGGLDDPTIAVAGAWGITSGDLRTFEDAPAGDVDAVEGYLLAFRRSDAAERGPLDERFRFYRNLDIWWSLVLRDEGEGAEPRRAVRVPDIPATRHDHRGWESLPEEERTRQSKRNFYRILDRFGPRRDLLVSERARR